MESERRQVFDAAKRYFAAAEEVQQCYYVTGEADFVLVVSVRSMAEYEALAKRLFFANNKVKRFKTFVVMDRVKVGLSVPVEPGRAEPDLDRRHTRPRSMNCQSGVRR